MLRFFQQIPQQLLTDKKFNTHVLYAIGEIQQEIHTE